MINKQAIAVLLSCIVFASKGVIAQNIALHKPYTLSARPNYILSDPNNTTALTDGVFTVRKRGNFWGQKAAIGWRNKQRIIITIDLEKSSIISSISYSTVRKTSTGVDYPSHIFGFLSGDGIHYSYVGDIAADTSNRQGSYKLKKFILSNISKKARYVTLFVIPNGKLIFCDEIQVYEGSEAVTPSRFPFKKNDLNSVVNSLIERNFKKGHLLHAASELLRSSGKSSDSSNKKELTRMINTLNLKGENSQNVDAQDSLLRQIYVQRLQNKYTSPFIVEHYSPWDTLSPFHFPEYNQKELNYNFLIPVGGVQYGAFTVTNASNGKQRFTFLVKESKSGIGKVNLFQVPFVPSIDHQVVPDPLLPLINNEIVLEPGEDELFFFNVQGGAAGSGQLSITIQSDRYSVTAEIDVQTKNIPDFENYQLNTNVWAYLTYPMLKDRQASAVRDLKAHHVNSIVIPPAVIPGMNNENYDRFLSYLNNFKEVKNIMLFTSYNRVQYRNGYKGGHYMDPQWKDKFVDWYKGLIKVIKENGFPHSNIYFYPYDEPRGKEIEDFKRLMQWAKKAVPGIRFYSTLTKENAMKKLLGLLDVAQISEMSGILKNLPPHDGEIWTYRAGAPARLKPPYQYYRLMSWKAFLKGYSGIGFWNYASNGPHQLNFVTDPLINPSLDHSVIYDGPHHSIISTRRWEAFRLGVEDYQILYLYAKKFGHESAIKYAQEVLNNTKSLNLADSVKAKMIRSLNE